MASGSELGQQLNEVMVSGKLVSNDQVLDLLQGAIQKRQASANGFLIDGYPRQVIMTPYWFRLTYLSLLQVDQAIEFEKKVCLCSVILYFSCSDEEMTKRLLNRGQTSGRADDNEETIKKRLDTFHLHTQPILDHFKSKLETINSERPVDEVFADVEKILQKLLSNWEHCSLLLYGLTTSLPVLCHLSPH